MTNVLSLAHTLLETLLQSDSNLSLILVSLGSVDVPVACLESHLKTLKPLAYPIPKAVMCVPLNIFIVLSTI